MPSLVPISELRARRDPLQRPPWNHEWKRDPITREEIEQALRHPLLDEPGHAWSRNCEAWTFRETCQRENHVMRIAYFVKHREAAAPVVLKPSGSMYDGYHRLAAAIHCGDEFIAAESLSSAATA